MLFLTVGGRVLRKTVRRVVRGAAAGLCAGGLFVIGGGVPSAHAEERTVLAVVTADSYADLKKQAGWLGTQIGQPGLAGMLESVLLMATQGRGLAGLDVKRPLGAVVTTDGGDLAVHGFVPVKSLDKLLDSLQAVTGPTEQSGDSRSLTLPNGIALDLVEQDGWAIVSPQGMDVEAVDPAPLFAPLAENYTLGIELFPHRLPGSLRQQLRMLIEQGAAAAGEQRQPLDARALDAAFDGLANTESLALGIAIDGDNGRLFLENRTVALPDSPMALAMQGADKGNSSVPMPPAVDGSKPAITAHLVQSVPEASRRDAIAILEQALPAASTDPLTKTLALLLRETIASVLATGGIDAAACVDTDDVAKNAAEKDGGKALPAVTAGIRVKDGAALETRIKQTFGAPAAEQSGGKRLLPPGVDVAFDSGKVGTTNLHTITVDLSGTEAAKRLGDAVNVTLAVTPEYAFLMAGGDPRQRLASLVGPAGKADSEAKPFVGVDVSVSRLMGPALAELGIVPSETPAAEAGAAGDRQGGDIKLLIRPIDRGVATRLSADAAAVRVLAAGAGALEPLGGANPNAFPVPVPAQ